MQVATKPEPQHSFTDYAVDSIRAIPGGLAKGAAGLAGLPGDVNSLINSGMDKLASFAGESPDVIKKMQAQRESLPLKPVTSSAINNAVSKPFGGYYQPQTIPGQYAETAASFAPNAIMPGTVGQKLARVLIPATTSETAGQATKGSSYEPLARAAGALVGGVGEGIGERLMAPKATIPSLADIGNAKTATYKAAEQQGVVIKPEAWKQFADDVNHKITVQGVVQPELHKNTVAALRTIEAEAASGAPITLEKSDLVRQVVNDAIDSASAPGANGGDLMRSAQIKHSLDDFLDNLKPTDTLAGDASTAVPILKEARSLAQREFKGKEIQKLIDLADNSASTNYTAAGYEQALRAQFKNLNAKLIKDPNLAKTFTDAERAAIVKVAQGGPLENSLRWLGRFGPNGHLGTILSGGAGASVGAAMGGPVGAALGGAGTLALGAAARSGATALTARNARLAGELMRTGQPAAQAAPMTPKLLSDLLLSRAITH